MGMASCRKNFRYSTDVGHFDKVTTWLSTCFMDTNETEILEGVFAVAKPASVSCADVLQKLQNIFATSRLFAPLRRHQPDRPSKDATQAFRMGHGGTLDPIASGVLIVGIGRGTKQLQQYLACSKTYETVVVFGASTDTYDCAGTIQDRRSTEHITPILVEEKLSHFKGTVRQRPPMYSAIKIDGLKACEYVRQGKQLPRQMESREVQVEECTLMEWYNHNEHGFSTLGDDTPLPGPAVRVRLTVSSGFYVRSFAHELGAACLSSSCMAFLVRTNQAEFTIESHSDERESLNTLTFSNLDAGESVWAAKLRPQLQRWVDRNPVASGHVNGRDKHVRHMLAADKETKPRQRFRGGWLAETKQERIKQQGGKVKGKRNRV